MSTILVQTRLLRGLVPPPEVGPWQIETWTETPQEWRAQLEAIEASLRPGPVLVHCTLPVARWLRHTRTCPRLSAGLVLPEAALRAHALNGVLGELALNQHALYAPFGALATLGPVLDAALGSSRFVRPDSSMKPFAGRPIPAGEWDREIAAITAVDRPDPGTLCMIAPLQNVSQPEWRFWCVEGTPITAAPYAFDRPELETGTADPALWAVAQDGARRLMEVDGLMVVDCAFDGNGAPKIVEANGFSTSGFYPGVDLAALWAATAELYVA